MREGLVRGNWRRTAGGATLERNYVLCILLEQGRRCCERRAHLNSAAISQAFPSLVGALNQIEFQCARSESGAVLVTPVVDGLPIAERAAHFERAHGYTDPDGGYGPLIPDHYNLGPLADYLMGRAESSDERIYIAFCACGDAGCWPLTAQVRVEADNVVWDSFRNEHRPARDYNAFGPFVFARAAYERAAERAAEAARQD